ncbi:MAG TPA: N-acetylmuramoyl-L-alanine amidase [Bryobacteraceae bacterium]|nr:N-acetylmuramoyl-L-alanine amidase [Bryobacteraceae bacterium]
MKLIALFALSIPLLAGQAEHADLHSVTAVRHWSLGDVTRVAIEVTGPFEFRTDRLHNPERVYFDIEDSRPRLGTQRIYTREFQDPLVQRVRVAQTEPGVTRVVLDLGASVEVTTSKITNPHRLMVELRAWAGPPSSPDAAPTVQTSAKPALTPAVARAEIPKSDLPPAVKPALSTSASARPVSDMTRVAADPVAPPAVQTAKTISPEPLTSNAIVPEIPRTPAAASSTAPAAPITGPPKAARRTSTGESSLIRALGLKVNRVVIDPGHGGHDQGTEGPKGLLEKDVVLDVSQRLGKLIESRMGAEVIYTRTDDTFIPLEARTALANDKKADLFISIHANSSSIPRINGVETYYLNFTDSQDALDVAARENASSQKSIFELRDIIQKITLHDKAEESREFASRVQASLAAFSARNAPSAKNRGVKKAPFVVLIGATMPSVLAEIGFLSNPKEEALLKRPDYRQKLAEALYRGLEHYAETLSHFQVAQN